MKKNKVQILYGLFLCLVVIASVRAWAENKEEEESRGAMGGAFVEDATVSVPTGAYITFSTVYNGKRYYLGVDTVQARLGKDTVTWYEGANYAAMWIAGPLWSYNANVLANKDYTRTIKSVWLEEQVSRTRYLAIGTGSGTYNTLRLLAEGTMWHTEKDSREQNRYINGYLYYYSDATGVDVYRYLRFDPVYGFSRLYEAKPQASQRISVWDRTTGSDLIYHMTPNSITFGYNPTHDTIQAITSQVYYYADVDRFRSRMDQADVYARRSEPIIDQDSLVNDYGLEGHWEWKSNPINEAHPELYNGNSLMPYYTIVSYDLLSDPSHPVPVWGWRDSAVVHVRQTGFNLVDNVWYDTIYAGVSPIDNPNEARFLRKPALGSAPEEGDYVNQNDWLYVHFKCAGREYRDSVYVVRQTFHQENYTTLELDSDPEDDVFPYSYNNKGYDGETPITSSDTARTFNISALYTSGYRVRAASGNVVFSHEGTRQTLNLLDRSSYNDGGVLYDTLLVEALNVDGTPPCDWIESVRLTARNQIRVKVSQYNPSAPANRTAQIRFMYRYRNVVDENDRAEAVRVIWISQEWSGAHATEPYIYSFTHKNTDADGLQAVHEKKNTLYAIPGENLSLPLHRDHWGYYRWFIYDEGIKKDRDLEYMSTWSYATGKVPENALGNDFMLINHSAAASSRGRWDVIRDVNNSGNPDFAQDHFVQWTQTPIPELRYPENEAASLTKSGKIACDVSEYYDVETTGRIGELEEMKEPTLSYRQIFDIQPAKIRADQMANVKGNGSGANWLEQHSVVAPAGRAFSLQPQCPIAYQGDQEIDEEHLQYIYYANPVTANAGTRTGLTDEDLQKNRYYARIGVKKRVNTYKKLTLITHADLMALGNNGSISNIVLVNPRKTTGLIVGNNNEQAPWYMDYRPYRATKTQLEDDLAAKLNDGGGYSQAYLTIQRNGTSNKFFFQRGNYKLYDLYTLIDIGGGVWRDYNVRWYNGDPTGSEDFTLGSYAGSLSDANLPSGYSAGDLVTLYANWTDRIPVIYTKKEHKGYLKGEYPIYCDDVNEASSRNPYYGWLIYKVETVSTHDFEEIPRWERSTDGGSTWRQVAHWDYTNNRGVSDVTGYTMTDDGVLHLTNRVHTTANQLVYYQLRTEHFQLAKFAVLTRDPDTEILKNGTIISEEEIDHNYNIIYKLDMEDWAAPGTTDVVAYNQPFDWDFTELSYHYPLSAISAENRVFTTEMPGKGEYAFINKFVVPTGPNTQNAGEVFECLSGAENGYMLCVNAAGKRTTIMNFEYNQLSCSGQQIYLVGNYCNPVNNGYNPQITADLEGSNDGETWTPIYRYKSGEIPYKAANNNPWHQMALPIARERIEGYKTFRCRAEINGAPNRNAHLLIDRLRFIEKSRSFSVFQNKATCIKDDSVTVLIRLNYHADPDLYQPGKLVAYQFQKWDKNANGGAGGYVSMLASKSDGAGGYIALDDTTDPKLEVFPGYLKDAFTATESVTKPFLKSMAGNDYGYVMIPEADYDPSLSNTVAGQSTKRGELIDAALIKLGITGPAAATRKANFLDETANIRTFDEVVANDYEEWVNIAFGGVITPHIKSFVEVDGLWLLYIVCRLPVSATDNNTFRIGMTVMDNLDDTPTFAEESCATFRVLNIKQTTSLLLDGKAWPNKPRSVLEANVLPEDTLLASNETYRASIQLTVRAEVGTNPTSNPRCKFDLLHAHDSVRPNTTAGNLAFQRRYGCTRTEFVDAMEAFRIDDDRNPCRAIADWSQVTPESLTKTGRTLANATIIYNRLNKLINDGVLELALDYRDIYMGDKADSYFYLLPVPATGLFDVAGGSSTGTDTTMNASVCNDTLWLQLHSEEPTAKLRFGYDSRVGDTYVVPVIRASYTDATTGLKVRVAEISAEPSYAVVLGWDATELIDSDDPDWTAMKIFKYTQDKDMRTHKPSEFDYYSKGDDVTFVPQATGNTISLKAGHWYHFKTAFYSVLESETYSEDPGTPTGHTQFILAIAPDTVRWTPAFPDAANYWNDDHNWTALRNGKDCSDMIALVPMGDTKVIIPQVPEGQLPIVSDVVAARIDTLHYGYKKNTCAQILFKPRSQMLGQEMLDYRKAFVDVLFSSGTWQTFSPALEHIYSGDMYIPSAYDGSAATAASTDTRDFDNQAFPKDGEYVGSYNPRVWPYVFYQGFYNSSVPVAYYNTDLEGTPVATNTARSKSSVDWVQTNILDMPYHPGAACILNGYGMGDDGEELVVRLPKKEAAYHGYGKDPAGSGNYIAGPAVPMQDNDTPRPAYTALYHNLAYDKHTLGESDGIEYTLSNETASTIFFFGNPTMSLIDVYVLCKDNAEVLQHEAGTYHFTAYQLIEGSNYTVKNITGPGQYFVAPQRAVGLIANSAANSLTIKLKPGALVAITGDGTVVSRMDEEPSPAPRRAGATTQPGQNMLYIAAMAEATDEWDYTTVSKAYLTLGECATANRGFRKGEDALSIVSGLNYYSDASFNTPLSMYTIADNQALMLDIRDTLHSVPLVFASLDEYTLSEFTRLSFAMEGNWQTPLYLYDALTNDSIRIVNGLQIAVQTPANNQLRYFINGVRAPQNEQHEDIATGIEISDSNSGLTSNSDSGLTTIYDLLGRRIITLGEFDLISDIQLPTGVYLIQRGNNTERMVIR